MTRVGVITGLASEAACLRNRSESVWVRVAGADSDRAAMAADRLIAEGCSGLVSFGLAGGLDPALQSGTLVVADAVVRENRRRMPCNSEWRDRILSALRAYRPLSTGSIAATDRPVTEGAAKGTLHQSLKAVAVDTESHAVADRAAALDVPFVVLRVIADGGRRDVPAWVPATVGSDGKPRIATMLTELARHPMDTAALVRLAADYRRAMVTLRRVAVDLGPIFRFLG